MPKGMRDFFPEEALRREELFALIRSIFERYGFSPLITPALEEMSYLEKETSEEIKSMLFRISDSSLALRFDHTVPLARVMSENPMIPKPFKRYVIDRVWRREEPQKGRYREFWQADIDIVGSSSLLCEAELLACATEILKTLNIDAPYIINHRSTLDGLLTVLDVPSEKHIEVIRLIDKQDKMDKESLFRQLVSLVGEATARRLFEVFSWSNLSNEVKLKRMEALLNGNETGMRGVRDLQQLLFLASQYGYSLVVDFSLARGLDYYTGTVFEAKPSEGEKSVSGGGRYDTLIGMFGTTSMPAVGVSIGIERISFTGKGRKTITKVLVVPVDQSSLPYAIGVAQEFRREGIPTEIDLMERGVKKNIEYSIKTGIPFLAVVGPSEAHTHSVSLKNLQSHETNTVSLSTAIELIKKA